MTLQAANEALKKIAVFTPEYDQAEAFKEPYQELLDLYPALNHYTAYLDFLKATGGAHIHNKKFSLGVYGFGGYVVTSFDEGLFLDQERYFHFGEVLYHAQPDPIYVFAFDFRLQVDTVYLSPIEESDYRLCCNSFVELLSRFATGEYPGLIK